MLIQLPRYKCDNDSCQTMTPIDQHDGWALNVWVSNHYADLCPTCAGLVPHTLTDTD